MEPLKKLEALENTAAPEPSNLSDAAKQRIYELESRAESAEAQLESVRSAVQRWTSFGIAGGCARQIMAILTMHNAVDARATVTAERDEANATAWHCSEYWRTQLEAEQRAHAATKLRGIEADRRVAALGEMLAKAETERDAFDLDRREKGDALLFHIKAYDLEQRAHSETKAAYETVKSALHRAEDRELAAHAETKAALADIHKVTGRGDGHGSPKETASCVISAFVSRGIALTESDRELEDLQSQVDDLNRALGDLRG